MPLSRAFLLLLLLLLAPPAASKDHSHSSSSNLTNITSQLKSREYPPNCIHGYLSAADRKTCVCSYGWAGKLCTKNQLPSCQRRTVPVSWSCYGLLSHDDTYKNQPCSCIQECVDYERGVLERHYGEGGYAIDIDPIPLHPNIMQACSSQIEHLRQQSVVELAAGEHAGLGELIIYEGTDFGDCYANCSSVPGSVCAAHFCECPRGYAGTYCQVNTMAEAPRLGEDDQLLTFQLVELDGALMVANRVRPLYFIRHDYWSAPFFFEQLLRDRSVLVDDNASVILMPHTHDPQTDAAAWLAGMQRSGGLLPRLQRAIAADDPSRPMLILWGAFQESGKWVPLRASDPPTSLILQLFGSPVNTSNEIALPLNDIKFMPDVRVFRGEPRSANQDALARVPALQREREHYFNASAKALDLFFVGRTGLSSKEIAKKNSIHAVGPQCLNNSLFTLSRDECSCLMTYSECVRQFIYHNHRHSPRMYLRDTDIDKMKRSSEEHALWPGRAGADSVLLTEIHRSAFCLVAGGFNLDMRIVSAVMSGCIPLWTYIQQTLPLDSVLNQERFLVQLTPETRPALADLPQLFDCYTPETRAALLASLKMAWPAYSWGTGTAYHHTLLAIAKMTSKRVPSAMATILEIHGPRYVAEVLDVDLAPYADLPGMAQAIALREQLAASDPLQDLLREANACIHRIPGVGDPKATAAGKALLYYSAEFMPKQQGVGDFRL